MEYSQEITTAYERAIKSNENKGDNMADAAEIQIASLAEYDEATEIVKNRVKENNPELSGEIEKLINEKREAILRLQP